MLNGLMLRELAQSPGPLSESQVQFIYDRALESRRYATLASLLSRSDLPAGVRDSIVASSTAAVRAALAALAPADSDLVKSAVSDKRVTVVSAVADRLDLPSELYASLARTAPAQSLVALINNPRVPAEVKVTASARLTDLAKAPYFDAYPDSLIDELLPQALMDARILANVLPLVVTSMEYAKINFANLPMDVGQFQRLVVALSEHMTAENGRYWRATVYQRTLHDLLSRTDCPQQVRDLLAASPAAAHEIVSSVITGAVELKAPDPDYQAPYLDVWDLDCPVSDEQVNAFAASLPSHAHAVANAVSAKLTDAQFVTVMISLALTYPRNASRWANSAQKEPALRLLRSVESSPLRAAGVLLAHPFLLEPACFSEVAQAEAVLDATASLLVRVPSLKFPFWHEYALETAHTGLLMCMPAQRIASLMDDPHQAGLRRAVFDLLWQEFDGRIELWTSYTHLASTIKDRSVREVADAILDTVA